MSESKWEMGRAPEEPDTILIGSDGTFWCRVVGSPGEPAEPKARLMCAAPELLAALKEYLAYLPAFRSKPIGAPGSAARNEQDALIALEDRAKKVIANAEGKS